MARHLLWESLNSTAIFDQSDQEEVNPLNALPNNSTAVIGIAPVVSLLSKVRAPLAKHGNVSTDTELHHFSLIVYSAPAERAKSLAPDSFEIEESVVNGRKTAWVSVVSFLDSGSRLNGGGAFEQTCYCLHVRRDGVAAHWLLGISLGSLSAVASRNLWSLPWHLSAMEFQADYDSRGERYRNYRLQTQSQWTNASWEISDTGNSLATGQLKESLLPASLLSNTFSSFFERRDGSLGFYRTRYSDLKLAEGQLKHARCDLLEELGLLTGDEMMQPALAATQRIVPCQIYSPTIYGERDSPRRFFEIGQPLPAYAS